jgi:hypothetical protein
MEVAIMTNDSHARDEAPQPGGPPDVSPGDLKREERRGWTRFAREPGTDYAVIVAPDALIGRVEVFDESLRGLGLVVHDTRAFSVGQTLEIAYAGTLLRLQVRHITRREDGRQTIGVG